MDRYATLRHGLIGAWCPSISGSGYLLPDLSGRGLHGTLTNCQGGSNWTPQGNGQTLSLDGTNDHVITPTLNFNGSWYASLSMWLRYTTATSNGAVIFELSANYNNASDDFIFSLVTPNKVTVAFTTGTSKYNSYTFTRPTSNSWHHAVALYDRTLAPSASATRFFLNGVEQTGAASAVATAAATAGFGNYRAYIGARSGASFPLAGAIDDIRVYSRILTPSEISILSSARGVGLRPQRTRRVKIGSQFYTRVGGVWKTATPFIKVAGEWKQATPALNVSGTWK